MKITFLALILALTLSDCTVTEEITVLEPFPEFPETHQEIPFESPHGTVTKADTSYTFTQNKLTVVDSDTITETVDGTELRYIHVTIEGLIDQVVQDLINTKIAAKIEELKAYAKFDKIPVRPGFYSVFPPNQNTIKGLAIWANSAFNDNNILSLMFTVQVFIKNSIDSYEEDFRLVDALNFDLNTGNELTLSDLFVNGTDYEAILNERILMKSQHRIDPLSWELTLYDPPYEYLGGFDGLNGDVKFFLNSYDSAVSFLFNERYTEFRNGFSTVQINLPMKDLKDILAFGQRFTKEEPYLFTQGDPILERNYLYPAYTMLTTETIGSIQVSEEHYYDDTLSQSFKTLRAKVMDQERAYLSSITDPSIKSAYWHFWGNPEGPYMRVTSVIDFGIDSKRHNLSGAYRSDGHKLTFEDVYADGFDYRARFIAMIKQELLETGPEQDKVYDPEELFDALAPSLSLYAGIDGPCYVSISNDFIFDAAWDPGFFTFTDVITDDPSVFKIKSWK